MSQMCNRCWSTNIHLIILWCGHYTCQSCLSKNIIVDNGQLVAICTCAQSTPVDIRIKEKSHQSMEPIGDSVAASNTCGRSDQNLLSNTTFHPVCAAVERKIGIMYYENNVISSKRNVLKRKFTENNVVVELKPNVDEQDNAAGNE
ncbi:unnamed protein product [Rotaria magnacalcarata]|uniref:RING-type domain-containing protein n=3 Tax=Rotaria magnacalcarata TaxID=392030 RepID=A0A815Z567_9BILA|nr:unnamed protein product [Rotaria magnacalcarata]